MSLNKHWKEYTNPDYIGAYTFLAESNGSIVATPQTYIIEDVSQKEIIGDGGKRANRIVAKLQGQKKEMVVNATNSKKMVELFGEACMIPKNWIGKSVAVNAVKVLERRNMVWRMRITEAGTAVDKRPHLTPDHESWAKIKDAISKGAYTVEQIEKKYFINPENKKALCTNSK